MSILPVCKSTHVMHYPKRSEEGIEFPCYDSYTDSC